MVEALWFDEDGNLMPEEKEPRTHFDRMSYINRVIHDYDLRPVRNYASIDLFARPLIQHPKVKIKCFYRSLWWMSIPMSREYFRQEAQRIKLDRIRNP